MKPKELIRDGRIGEARKTLVEQIKMNPGDPGLRTLLVQVLICFGEWEKASLHLEAAAMQSPGNVHGYQLYMDLVAGEQERQQIAGSMEGFSFLPEKPEYADLYVEAVRSLKNNKPEDAKLLYEKIDLQLDNLAGKLNGKAFKRFTNPDAFLTYFLEVFVHGRHVLVPFENVRELLVKAPNNFFDLIWPQASLTLFNGMSMNCFLPALYIDSCQHDDHLLQMGKLTDWKSLGESFVKGIGQQIFDVDGQDIGVLEVRELQFYN